MWSICKKELRCFFSSLTGYLAIAVFLLLMGLFLFIFPETSILDYGFATMDKFFELAPWILILLVPAITMRSFSEEFKSGTYELLKTKPLTSGQIVRGKYWASFIIAAIALLPSLLYAFTIQQLIVKGGIDTGGIAGSYMGLLMLVGSFTAIGTCCSALTDNAVISFLIGATVCFIFYNGFEALSRIDAFKGNIDYYLEQVGFSNHYKSMSRGLIEIKNIIYFIIIICFFMLIAKRRLIRGHK